MKSKNIVLLTLAILGFFWYQANLAARALRFSAGRITDFSFKNGAISFIQSINVTNGNRFPIPIRSVNIINLINGQEVGTSILTAPTVIRGGATTELRIAVNIPYFDLLGLGLAVVSVIKTGVFNMTFRGNLNSLLITAPINQAFKIDISQFKNIFK
jgi:hypothetical protein